MLWGIGLDYVVLLQIRQLKLCLHHHYWHQDDADDDDDYSPSSYSFMKAASATYKLHSQSGS